MEGDEENGENACRFVGADGAAGDSVHKSAKRSRSPPENVERERAEKEELELSLGLSMNGRFGIDPAGKKMRRSSSVSNIVFGVDCAGDGGASGVGGHAPLVRTCSLPPDAHVWRRREEGGIGMEKLKDVDDGVGLHGDGNGSFDVKMARDGFGNHLVKGATQTATTETGSCRRFLDKMGSERGSAVLVANTGTTDEALLKNALVDMPYVSTRGVGPNHNKIEGFLYRYKRGEEVKIVCICHGMFLSPAEFVKHGGGGDVAYPLKHIVVNPFPLY